MKWSEWCSGSMTLLLSVWVQRALTLESSNHWWTLGRTELAMALNVRDNWGVAKNVILFIGDGMGITASTAARWYKGQKKGMNGEEGYLVWERFPNSAIIKTYNVDRQVPDSAATATAFMCGVKVNYETLGVDPSVLFNDCEASKKPGNRLSSALQWAQEAGKATGIVTTTRITHATPAATYSFAANRRWECNRRPGQLGHGCPDIAEQLVLHNPGKNIKVILGGGRQTMGAGLGIPDSFACNRTDNRDLTKEWVQLKKTAGHRARYITSAAELRRVDLDNVDYLMGLFADSHLPFVTDTVAGSSNTPTLAEMARTAITLLKKEREGFFLLVEGGRIDHGLHNNQAKKALEETLALDEAISTAMKEVDLSDTLMIVTADHSHVLTINGYPKRGNSILGNADISSVDGLNYTTLMFTNGPGFNVGVKEGKAVRTDPGLNQLSDPENKAHAAVPMKEFKETHGGEDVALYAAGPMSHLFHRLHEQNYIAHVMAYAACIGPSAGHLCQRPKFTTNLQDTTFSLPHSPLKKNDGEIFDNFIRSPDRVDSAAEAAQVASDVGIDIHKSLRQDLPEEIAASERKISPRLNSKSLPSSPFPAMSPRLQSLLENSQQRLIDALGLEEIPESDMIASDDDISGLIGKPALIGHESHML